MKRDHLHLEAFAGLSREATISKLRSATEHLSLAETFILLHRLGIYHGEESWSGAGSSLAETAALRNALPMLVEEYGIRRMLDVPCGDFHWMQHVDLGSVEYSGADIVPDLVTRNTERFGAPERTFVTLDITRERPPAVDLVLCRDLFIHLSLADVDRAILNIVESGSRLLLASHFRACSENVDIRSGEYHPINLCAPPFRLPPPIKIIDEHSQLAGGAGRDRSMALWLLDDLRTEPSRA